MTNKSTYDIAIVGGGLAGLCLSIQAAKAGYAVVLFEKECYPFHRVCGEYISNESRPFLEQLGVPLASFQLPFIDTLHTSDEGGNLYPFALPLGGFGISRYKLDECLYQLALSHGVVVHTGFKVVDVQHHASWCQVTGTEASFTATVGVCCYGKRSNLDVKWDRPFVQKKDKGLNNYIGIKYHIKYKHPENVIALHNFKDGYCGISKIEGDNCCLCYLTTAINLKAHGNAIPQMEQAVLYNNKYLKDIFTTATFLFDKPVAISQVSFSSKQQVVNHLLMAGDSAGMITPLCGNGMSMAMHGSKIAFKAIDRFLKGQIVREEMEHDYSTQWRKHFATRLTVGRAVQQLFGGNLMTSLFLRMMAVVPPIAKELIKMTHGKPF